MVGKAQRIQILDRVVRIKNTHHHFFTEGGGQGRYPHFDFVAAWIARLDTAIQGAALLDHIHAPEQFDTGRHRIEHAHRHLVDLVQHTIDAKAYDALLAPWLQVDVTGTLIKGVLPQPVHHHHHALVIGIELSVGLAQLHQLLEAGTIVGTRLVGRLDGLGQGIELCGVPMHLLRAGQHTAHRAFGLALDLGHPIHHKRLRCGHRNLMGVDHYRQYTVPLRIDCAHGIGHLAHIYFQRVNAQVIHTRSPSQPLGQ